MPFAIFLATSGILDNSVGDCTRVCPSLYIPNKKPTDLSSSKLVPTENSHFVRYPLISGEAMGSIRSQGSCWGVLSSRLENENDARQELTLQLLWQSAILLTFDTPMRSHLFLLVISPSSSWAYVWCCSCNQHWLHASSSIALRKTAFYKWYQQSDSMHLHEFTISTLTYAKE